MWMKLLGVKTGGGVEKYQSKDTQKTARRVAGGKRVQINGGRRGLDWAAVCKFLLLFFNQLFL